MDPWFRELGRRDDVYLQLWHESFNSKTVLDKCFKSVREAMIRFIEAGWQALSVIAIEPGIFSEIVVSASPDCLGKGNTKWDVCRLP